VALAWACKRAWAGRTDIEPGREVRLDAADLPRALRLRLVERALRTLSPAARPRGAELARLLATLDAGGQANLAGVLARAAAPTDWRFTPEPPRTPRDATP
jgi:tRNA(Ile)-lysidine synthase